MHSCRLRLKRRWVCCSPKQIKSNTKNEVLLGKGWGRNHKSSFILCMCVPRCVLVFSLFVRCKRGKKVLYVSTGEDGDIRFSLNTLKSKEKKNLWSWTEIADYGSETCCSPMPTMTLPPPSRQFVRSISAARTVPLRQRSDQRIVPQFVENPQRVTIFFYWFIFFLFRVCVRVCVSVYVHKKMSGKKAIRIIIRNRGQISKNAKKKFNNIWIY